MAWELHRTTTGRALEDKVTIGARYHRSQSGRTHISVTLRIGRKLGERIGLTAGNVAVFWGTDKHAGWLRLDQKAPGRGLAIRPTSEGARSSFSLVLGPRAAETHEREECKAIVVADDVIDVKLPAWVQPPAAIVDIHTPKARKGAA